jgi:hypothetical protein
MYVRLLLVNRSLHKANCMSILQLFDEATSTFSKGKTPLIADAVEALETIESSLAFARDSPPPGTLNIVRVAAAAGVLVAQKYLSLLDDCEIYAIAIGKLPLSPNHLASWHSSC